MKDIGNPNPPQLRFRHAFGTLAVGLAIVSLTIAIIVASLNLPPAYSPRDVGPAVFPLIASIVTLIFCLAAIVRDLAVGGDRQIVFFRPGLVVAGIATIVAYVSLIPVLGTYVSSALLVTGTVLMLGLRKPLMVLTANVITLGLVYVGFELLLNVRFPRGALL